MEEDASLVEIGPRFVLNLIKIFQGSFGGPTLYENPGFQSPNMVKSSSCLFTFLSTLLNCLLCLHLIFLFTHTLSTGEGSDWRQQPECARSRWWRSYRKWRGLTRRRTCPEISQRTSSWRRLMRSLFISRRRHLSPKWWRRTNTRLSKDRD